MASTHTITTHTLPYRTPQHKTCVSLSLFCSVAGKRMTYGEMWSKSLYPLHPGDFCWAHPDKGPRVSLLKPVYCRSFAEDDTQPGAHWAINVHPGCFCLEEPSRSHQGGMQHGPRCDNLNHSSQYILPLPSHYFPVHLYVDLAGDWRVSLWWLLWHTIQFSASSHGSERSRSASLERESTGYRSTFNVPIWSLVHIDYSMCTRCALPGPQRVQSVWLGPGEAA